MFVCHLCTLFVFTSPCSKARGLQPFFSTLRWDGTLVLHPSSSSEWNYQACVKRAHTHMLEWPSSLCNSGYVSSTGQWNRCSDPNPCEPQTPSLCKAISRAQLAGTVQEIDIYQLPYLHNSKNIGDINSKTCIQVKPI